MSVEKMLTIAEVAELLRVKPHTVRQRLWRGLFPETLYTRASGRTLFFAPEIQMWLKGENNAK